MYFKKILKYSCIKLLRVAGIRDYKNWRAVPLKLRFVNFIFQKIFLLNSACKHSVHFTSQVNNPAQIKLSKSAIIHLARSGNCYLNGKNGISIGEGSIFAPGVKIVSANHNLNDYSKYTKDTPVVIGEKCWLGANVTILPNVNLGNNVIVAAGAVVTKSFGSNLVIGGVPAKVLKTLEH